MYIKFLIIFFIFFTLALACGSKKTIATNHVANCVLEKYNEIEADVTKFHNRDTLEAYRISSPEQLWNTPENFGSFVLEIISHKTSIIANNNFFHWKQAVANPTEFDKTPQFRFVHQNYIFRIETACGNEKNLDSIFYFIQDCFTSLKNNSIGLVKIKCGGGVIEN